MNTENIKLNPGFNQVCIWPGTFGDDIKVIKIDTDKNAELCDALRIKHIPTVLIYKDGEQRRRLEVNIKFEYLTSLINEYL